MKMEHLILKCAQAGVYFSRRAIYDAGEKYGFAIKKENQTALEFDEEKFNEWLKKVTEEIPTGFQTMKECSKALNLSVVTIWKYLQKYPEVETKKIGSKKGVTYANIEQLRKTISKYKYGIEEN